MNYRLATAQDLMQLAELRWDFRMEDGDELPAVSRTEFIEACVSFLKRGLKNDYHIYWQPWRMVKSSHTFLFTK